MDAKDTVTVQLDSSNSVTVHLHGGTVVSWLCSGDEMLFVSTKAVFDNKKAIRGGIPLVFPNFGPWPLGPQHGFARISRFAVVKQNSTADCASATFSISDTDKTREMWPHKFEFQFGVQVGKGTLELSIEIKNTGEEAFDFTTLLHTYFRTQSGISVQGLKGSKYEEREGGEGVAEEDVLAVKQFIDRTYIKTPAVHTLTGVAKDRTVTMTKTNLPDTVVWNPWEAKAAAMSDFNDDGYLSMLCVEAGYVSERAVLQPAATFTGGVQMKCNCC